MNIRVHGGITRDIDLIRMGRYGIRERSKGIIDDVWSSHLKH